MSKQVIRKELLIHGDNGELFSVTDDLTGVLHSVADISGVPVFAINEDGTSYFAGAVSGINPTADAHFATKAYVDANSGGITDAPSDGNTYGRNNGAWAIVSGGGGGDVFLANTQTFTGVNTFSAATVIGNNQLIRSANSLNSIEIYNGTDAHMNFRANHGTPANQVIEFFTGANDALRIESDAVTVGTTHQFSAVNYYLGADRFLYTVSSNHNFDLKNATNTTTFKVNATGSGTVTTGTVAVDTLTEATASGGVTIPTGVDLKFESSSDHIEFGQSAPVADSSIITVVEQSGGSQRNILMVSDSNNTVLCHRGANGYVEIRGNNATAGATGESQIIEFKVTGITASYDITAPAFFESSDETLKENIVPLDDRYRAFNFIGKSRQRYGVIAQELEKTHSELVKKGDNGKLSVNYIDLLVLEIVELKQRIKDLEDGA